MYCFNCLYRLCRTRDISVVMQSFRYILAGEPEFRFNTFSFHNILVSSIAKVTIVLCYCSVFEKLIISSKSLIEVLEKFFKCLETRTLILERQNSKLSSETRFSILDSQNLRGPSFELRLSTYICPVLYAFKVSTGPRIRILVPRATRSFEISLLTKWIGGSGDKDGRSENSGFPFRACHSWPHVFLSNMAETLFHEVRNL